MAVDTKNLFGVELPAALGRNADDAKTIGSKFQLNVTGSGEWFIDVSETGPAITAGNPGGADCTLTLSEEDFQKLYENPQANGMTLYMGGKLKIQGNPMLATKLQKLFAYKLPSRRTRSSGRSPRRVVVPGGAAAAPRRATLCNAVDGRPSGRQVD